jgi:hypothetical protein
VVEPLPSNSEGSEFTHPSTTLKKKKDKKPRLLRTWTGDVAQAIKPRPTKLKIFLKM